MPARRATDRTIVGQIGAQESWAQTADRSARTAPARACSPSDVEWHARRLDPDGRLEPGERNRRAEHARKAYFLRLALKSAQARRKASAA